LLIVLTVGAVSAEDNATQIDSIGDEGEFLNDVAEECDNTHLSIPENEDMSVSLDNSVPADSYEDNYDNKYYLFRGDCWTVNNNFESSAAITSETHSDFTITGTFRTQNDIVGVYWNSKDPIQHPYISYGNVTDYSDVVLEFDYEMIGCKDFSNGIVNIAIASNGGETYFLTMNRFIRNSHVTLNFNDLTLLAGNSYFDKNGNSVVVSEETKLDVSDLKYVMLEILPVNFEGNGDQYTITQNTDFTCKIFNITVKNGEITNEQLPLSPHQYRLCEGYDDIYNLNPMRISKEMRKLGYVEWVDFYIGASYFYEKSGVAGDIITDLNLNHNRTEKMVLNKEMPLNSAFKAWLDCYARELKKNGVDNLAISVSMENLQCPQSWRQMDSNGNFAMSGWVPSTFFYSPCHEDVIPYMQSVSQACLDIVADNGFRPILQMGETWWWWSESNSSNPVPFFYDASTKEKYMNECGMSFPEYFNAGISEYDKSAIDWLNQQLCQYSDALREVVKGDRYEDGIYMALLFTPSVIDPQRVPAMMNDANYLKDAYTPDKLDILQIEDYDWVIFENQYHNLSYAVGEELGFSPDCIHYFGGFVQNPEDADNYWGLIKESMDDALKKGFGEVFVWAGSQVRRDNKILGFDEDELVDNLSPLEVTSPAYVSVGENFKISVSTQDWANGHLNIHECGEGKKGKLLVSKEIINGKSSLELSIADVGLNRFYLDFNCLGGEYHLILNVNVIENSKNVSVNVPCEIENGSDLEIVLNASEASADFICLSIDGSPFESYDASGGKFSKSISNLSPGYHAISIKCGLIYSNTFTVNVGLKTIIEADDLAVEYGSGKKLAVILKDDEGNALKGKSILIKLNGLNHTVLTDDDGKATLTIDSLPGTYLAEILFDGDEGYLSSFGTAKVTVNKINTQVIASDMIAVYNVAKYLIVTVKDGSGKALSAQNVIVKLNNKDYNLITDANGQSRLSVSLPAKKYVASIVFKGNGIYKASSRTVNVAVKKAAPKMTVSSKKFKAKTRTKKVTAKLKTNMNKAIKKATVYLKVSKKTYKAKTNSKGVATFKVKLTKKGRYAAVYTFKGNSNFKAASKKFRITVK